MDSSVRWTERIVLLPVVTGRDLSRTVLSYLTFSAWIEAVQYVCTVGCPELIDVALNTLGAVVGYGIWALATAARRRLCGPGGKGA
jgi:glycopeptide antibiotics resistance protein